MEKVRFGIIGYGVQGKFYSAILTGGELPGIGRIPQPEGCVLSAISVRRKEALEQLQQIPGVSLTRTYVVLDNVKENMPAIPRIQAASPLK